MRLAVCPKCGESGSLVKKWVRNGKSARKYRYWYVKHYNPKTQNARWCYLPRSVAEALISTVPNTSQPVLESEKERKIAVAFVDYINNNRVRGRAQIPIWTLKKPEKHGYLIFRLAKMARPSTRMRKIYFNEPLRELKGQYINLKKAKIKTPDEFPIAVAKVCVFLGKYSGKVIKLKVEKV